MQQVTVTIPDVVFGQEGTVIARNLLEMAVLEAYRAEVISIGRLADILGFSIDEANAFLKANQTAANLGFEEIEHGFDAMNSLLRHQ